MKDKQCVLCGGKTHLSKDCKKYQEAMKPRMKRANTGYTVEQQFLAEFVKNQKPLEPDFAKVLDDNFYEMIVKV